MVSDFKFLTKNCEIINLENKIELLEQQKLYLETKTNEQEYYLNQLIEKTKECTLERLENSLKYDELEHQYNELGYDYE